MDEPTTGLHFDDVKKLLHVLHRLTDLGNMVVIIEHNLDVIRNADWILDLGPEGGEDGGRIVGEGRPAKIAATPASYTGQFLARYYKSSNGRLEPVEPDAPLTIGEDAPSLDGHPEQAMRVEEPVSLRSKTKRTAAKKTAKRKYTRRKKTVLP